MRRVGRSVWSTAITKIVPSLPLAAQTGTAALAVTSSSYSSTTTLATFVVTYTTGAGITGRIDYSINSGAYTGTATIIANPSAGNATITVPINAALQFTTVSFLFTLKNSSTGATLTKAGGALLNAADASTGVILLNGGLGFDNQSHNLSVYSAVRGTVSSNAKVYFEATLGLNGSGAHIGYALTTFPLGNGPGGTGSAAYDPSNGYLDSAPDGGVQYATSTNGDVLGFALDRPNQKLWLRKNGTWLNGDPVAGTGGKACPALTGPVCPFVSAQTDGWDATTAQAVFNFSATPPTGFVTIDSLAVSNVTASASLFTKSRTPYSYLHGGGLNGIANYGEAPWQNWEKSAQWYLPDCNGVVFDVKGFPQNNPTDYPSHIASMIVASAPSGGTVTPMPNGNYYVKTDGHIGVQAGSGCTFTQSGLSGTDIAAGVWKMTISGSPNSVIVRTFLGGGAGTGTPMTHFRIRTDTGAGIPASLYSDEVVWRQSFLDTLVGFKNLRFMDWMRTNDQQADKIIGAKPTSWANRATKDSFSWCSDTQRGVPVEIMVGLCNLLNVDGWFNLHYFSTSAYQTAFAQYVHDNLNTGLVAHYEHSNEVWNSGNWQTSYSVDDGRTKSNASTAGYAAPGADEFGDSMRNHSDKIKAMAVIINGIYSDKPQAKRNVIAGQSGYYVVGETKAQFNNCYQVCDVYSPAPYFFPTFDMSVDANWAALGDGVRGSTAWYAALKASTQAGVDKAFAEVQHNVAFAHSVGLELACYEGGQHLLNATYNAELLVFNASQDMGDLYTYYIQKLRTIPGIMINWFVVTGPWSQYGYWGLKQNFADADTPKFTAIKADAGA